MVENLATASQVTTLFLINYAFNWAFAERIGRLIGIVERRRSVEYVGLIIVFALWVGHRSVGGRVTSITCFCPGHRDRTYFKNR